MSWLFHQNQNAMKKIYFRILFTCVLLVSSVKILIAQPCNIAPIVVTGNTLSCSGSSTFTLTATTPNSLTTRWYAIPEGGNAISVSNSYTTPLITSGATYYVGQSTSVSSQSITQPPHVTTILAMSRGYWFTAPVSFMITGLRVPTDASNGIASVAVLKFSGAVQPPLYPTTTNSFTTLFLDQLSASGTNTINVNIPIFAGDVIGILGDRNDTTSYSPNPYNGFLGPNPITLNRMGMLFNLSTNVPQDIWTETINNIGRVEVYTSIGCLSTLTPVSVSVSTPPQVLISGPQAAVCSGAVETLLATGANSYTWTGGPNTDTNTITAGVNTDYTVTGANIAGCTNTAVFPLIVNPLPTVSITPSQSVVCLGKTETLFLSGANTYTWYTGFNTTSISISPVVTSTYSASGTDLNGCIGTATITMGVSTVPGLTITPSRSEICSGQSATLNVNSAGSASSYSWNGGQTTQNLVINPTSTSNYTVVGTNSVGCSKSSSILIIVSPCTGISEYNGDDSGLRIFPNPATSYISIQNPEAIQRVVIRDVSGRIVLEQKVDNLSTISFNLENLSKGIYTGEVTQQKTIKTFKLIKD